MAMETSSSQLQPGTQEYDDLKMSFMKEIEAKLSHTEESMWRRGLKEIKRLQIEQQEFTAVVADLKDSQTKLIAENDQLRAALCDVTSKFEQVVTEVRNALRQMQQGAGRPSPSPSVASTAASPSMSEIAPCLGGQVMRAPELAQGRVHVGHLERALQRYTAFPETFEDTWQRLGVIQEKALLVSEINNIVENKLDARRKVGDEGTECSKLLLQYEDALLKLKKETLAVLESQSAKRASQDESFSEPTPPSSLGNVSMNLGLTPSWPTCATGDSSGETFLTPPRASVPPQDQALLGEAGWASWQGQYISPPMPDARCQPVPPPAVLSLASALTEAPTYASPPPTVPSCNGAASASGGLQLQLAECLDEPRAQTVTSGGVLSSVGATVPAMPMVSGAPTLSEGFATWQDNTIDEERRMHYATPPVGYLTVELQKEPEFMTLDMEVNEIDGKALQVIRIDDTGLVGRYNTAQGSEATRVRVRDVIVEVNGVLGDSGKMLQECKAQQKLVFTIARNRENGLSPEASPLPSTGAMQGSSGLGDGLGIQVSPDTAEIDRVLAEVAAPPTSWGRLRPEARVFVPSSTAQVSEEKSPIKVGEAGLRVPKVDPAIHENADPSTTSTADAVVTDGPSDQDKVARLLFP